VRDNRALSVGARVGLVGRAVFYFVLAWLVVEVARGGDRQADPNGALHAVAAEPFGLALIAVAAFGFAAFAAIRAVTAVSAIPRREGVRPVLRAGAEMLAYGALAAFTLSFLLGDRSAGSNRSHHSTTARLLEHPAGRALVVAIGAGVVVFYGYQLWEVATQGFAHRLDDRRMPRWLGGIARVVGSAGLVARAVAFVPVGAFLVVAAVTRDPQRAKSLDQTLHDMAGRWWGLALLAVVAFGLAMFGVYSLLEAGWRRVERA
jgi:hypothetical protein